VASIDAPKGTQPVLWMTLPALAPRSSPNANAIVPRAPTADTDASASKTAAKFRRAGFITAGVLAVLGVTFTVTGIVVHENIEDRSTRMGQRLGFGACLEAKHQAECTGLARMNGARDLFDGAAVASFVTSGVIGGAALSSFWWAPRERGGAAPLQVKFGVGRRQGGAALTGAW